MTLHRLLAPTLAATLLGGCFLAHGGPEEEPPPEEPPPEEPPPEEPPPEEPPPEEPPPEPGEHERFVFLRAEPSDALATPVPRAAWSVDLADGHERELFALETDHGRLSRAWGRGELVVVRAFEDGTRSVHMRPDGTRLGDSGLQGRVAVSPRGEHAVYLSPDEIVVADESGRVTKRLDVPGSGGAVSPSRRWVLRGSAADGDAMTGTLSVVDLVRDEVRTVEMPGTALGRVWFDEDELEAHVAIAPTPITWSLPEYTVYSLDLTAEPLSLEEAALGADLRGLAYDRCEDRMLATDAGQIVAVDPLSGESELVAPAPLEPTGPALPFAQMAELSPDGRYLVWLGGDDETKLFVTDRAGGTTTEVALEEPIPAPSSCCGSVFSNIYVGNFSDGALAIGVAPWGNVPLCSCGPGPSPEPVAYRLDLASAEAVAMDHCGLSRPWLTRDGRVLLCKHRGPGDETHLVLHDPAGGEQESVTSGPVDFAAFPLERGDLDGCGVRR